MFFKGFGQFQRVCLGRISIISRWDSERVGKSFGISRKYTPLPITILVFAQGNLNYLFSSSKKRDILHNQSLFMIVAYKDMVDTSRHVISCLVLLKYHPQHSCIIDMYQQSNCWAKKLSCLVGWSFMAEINREGRSGC